MQHLRISTVSLLAVVVCGAALHCASPAPSAGTGSQAQAVVGGVPVQLARLIGSAAVYFGFSYPLWGRIFRIADPPDPA